MILMLMVVVVIMADPAARAESSRSWSFEPREHFDVVYTDSLLYETHETSLTRCSLLCGLELHCVTFTFSVTRNDLGTCRGHSIIMGCRNVSSMTKPRTKSFQLQARNCKDVRQRQAGSGVAQLTVSGDGCPVTVYCDQDGWTVIQRRQNGSVNFYRNWTDYQVGFGDPVGEYWLGLENLHKMTTSQRYEVRFDLQLFNDTQAGYAVYSDFSVGRRTDFYRLSVGTKTTANLVDHIAHHKGYQFSTEDADHDGNPLNCAAIGQAGWWYNTQSHCGCVNLNSPYRMNSTCAGSLLPCIFWYQFGQSGKNALKTVVIKIRPM